MKALITITLTIIFLTLTSCDDDKNCVTGSGAYTTKEYNINDISSISISSVADVYIVKGETSLRIEGQANILKVLEVSDDGGHLEIGEDNCFEDIKTLKIYISTPEIDDITTAGVISVYSSDIFISEHFYINTSGVTSIDLRLETSKLFSNLSGTSNITLSGTATEHNIDISGEGNIYSYDLETAETMIDISGMAFIETYATSKLDVKISGSGKVHYKGSPQVTQKIDGSGEVINKN